MVFAPFVFKTFAVLVEKCFPDLSKQTISAGVPSTCSVRPPVTGTLYSSVMAEVGNKALLAGSWIEAENRI